MPKKITYLARGVSDKILKRVQTYVGKMKRGNTVSAFGLALDKQIYGCQPELLHLHRAGVLSRHKSSGQIFYKKL